MDKDRFLKDLFWTSYRYCIGRHSYVSSYASDMGNFFYDKLNDIEKENNAQDIRRTIADCLQMYPFCIQFDWSIPSRERKPLEFLLTFINSMTEHYENTIDCCDEIQRDLATITKVKFYKENDEIKWEVSTLENPRFDNKIWEHEILDFLPWADLASYLDVPNYKTVLLKDGTKYKVYESYCNESNIIETKNNMLVSQSIPWRYKKIYRPVDKGVSNYYIDSESIVEIK